MGNALLGGRRVYIAQGLGSRTPPKKLPGKAKNPPKAIKLRRVLSNSADFSGASPVASALGLPLGRDPLRKSKPYNKASDVASNNNASSTTEALRAAAMRKAVSASLFTLRGTPLVA